MPEPQRKEKKCKHAYWQLVPGTAALRRQLADLYDNFVQQKLVVGVVVHKLSQALSV